MQLAQISDTILYGTVFDPKRWSDTPTNMEHTLSDSITALFILLNGREIDYALVGGIALLAYVEGRNTQDIDLLLALSSLDQLPELLVLTQERYFVRATYDSLQVDLLLTQNPLFELVHRQHTTRRSLFGHDLPIATVEGLILLKLYALPSLYRQGNFARVGLYENDVATLLHYYSIDETQLLETLASHLTETDMNKIKNIIIDIRKRLQRFTKESNGD